VLRRALAFTFFVSLSAIAQPKTTGQGRWWVGGGFDSNAARDFVTAGRVTVPDGFGFSMGSLEGRLRWRGFALGGAAELATRHFFTQRSEDLLVQSAQAQAQVALGRLFDISVLGRLRDRRGAQRDYSDFAGEAAVTFAPDAKVEATLRGALNRFSFWPRPAYGFFGPGVGLTARYRFDARHTLSLSGHFSPRAYDGQRNVDPRVGPDEQPMGQRRDVFATGSFGYSYRGSFLFSVSYTYLEQASNAYGESLRRHRVAANAGFRLPARLSLLTALVLQASFFPDNIFLSPDLQVVEDDENSSYFTAKLVVPLIDKLDLDLRYAFYLNVLPGQTLFVYTRHVASVGLAISL
jgi:hypothetical protein